MPSREYQVEANDVVPEGFWPGAPLEVGPDGIEQLMFDAAHVLKMVGGTFSVVAIREELVDVNEQPTGMFATVGYRGQWTSFAPARRAPKPQPPEAVEPTVPEVEVEAPAEAELSVPQDEEAEPEQWPEDAERALAAEPV